MDSYRIVLRKFYLRLLGVLYEAKKSYNGFDRIIGVSKTVLKNLESILILSDVWRFCIIQMKQRIVNNKIYRVNK